ncbi:imidazole glycerol phosphate synthase subunit HisH [Parafilimonas terrae]|uniref:Imidazole glycerol phosphate synthase subunit HisH n=1 Tax=Parafilimonas terrae TaxID=1465490 RepID=A0A1I5SJI9_9BACT|nr:imidazole glycerol phosphate synthase subunit HisH [Parafilimonas terrae]SFP70811.1 imidazole glycerol phosphate synthase subunit hisH [Parafilimonas terrae]
MKIVIIKYNAGNVCSVEFGLQRLGVNAVVTDDAEEILSADKIIFPGVGAAGFAMDYLRERNLDVVIKTCKQPFLGICLGMQLLCAHSEESNTQCIGVFDEQVKKFTGNIKVPQMGWNNIYNLQQPLFKGLNEQEYVYFVHSFYVEKSAHTAATANYGLEYSAALQKDNFYAAQFHPEKSGKAGEKILKNFIEL